MDWTLHHEHPWNLSPAEAIRLQNRLRETVVLEDRLPPEVRTVAGIDVGFRGNGTITRAAAVVLRYPDLLPADQSVAELPTAFPYVPGLLSFREIPAVLEALKGLSIRPDLLLVDGQGYAHPRRLGIASHLGVLIDWPTIGVGKTRLVGRHGPVPDERGAAVPLIDHDETIGAVLCSRTGVQPLFISAGHRISQVSAVEWVMHCTRRFRLPETTRHAHRLASEK